MLKPRFDWTCYDIGCCVYVGGTEDYDLYMGKCHLRPWDPQVILVDGSDPQYEFKNQESFAKSLDKAAQHSAAEREALGRALNFVQCFFPTPERWTLNELAKASTE